MALPKRLAVALSGIINLKLPFLGHSGLQNTRSVVRWGFFVRVVRRMRVLKQVDEVFKVIALFRSIIYFTSYLHSSPSEVIFLFFAPY